MRKWRKDQTQWLLDTLFEEEEGPWIMDLKFVGLSLGFGRNLLAWVDAAFSHMRSSLIFSSLHDRSLNTALAIVSTKENMRIM